MELKDCPFCGGLAILEEYGDEYFIYCLQCNIEQGHPYKNKQRAMIAWNKRFDDEHEEVKP